MRATWALSPPQLGIERCLLRQPEAVLAVRQTYDRQLGALGPAADHVIVRGVSPSVQTSRTHS